MKDIRFYAEYPEGVSKRRPVSEATNVIALLIPEDGSSEWYSRPNGDGGSLILGECIAGVFDHADSAVAGTCVARDYLIARAKRVPERVARKIHPQLFAYLDKE
jgi:hypothetical protein